MSFVIGIVVLGALTALVLNLWSDFGSNPSGERLKKVETSTNYKDGNFVNLQPTDVMRKGVSTLETLQTFLFGKKSDELEPRTPVPSVQTDLGAIQDDVPVVVWFGHSSYLIKYRGKNILVDPVLSGYASPFSFLINAFPGTHFYTPSKMPNIDLVIISHDHYDHLDFTTLTELKGRVAHLIVPLGVGSHLERWGISRDAFTELDWWESKKVNEDLEVTATPARHFSGRGLVRNKTLWASFVLRVGAHKIFIGGDSGYDAQFTEIGKRLGPIDLAMLECGQYNEDWPMIHMFPEESAQAGKDLGARQVMAVHWGKFVLAYHSWKEPIQRFLKKAHELGLSPVAPRIGEPIILGQPIQNEAWWIEGLDTGDKPAP
ncbi:MAG: MBL fold metallo-hydrolase [Bdellovibrionales bacterium]|nr:MBL fold metallo-hydrolase [Bdellovibrionales bacterium]